MKVRIHNGYRSALGRLAGKAKPLQLWVSASLLLGELINTAYAANPFGDMGVTAAQLESKAGSTTSSTLQYILIAIGVLLCAIGAIKLIGIATKDKNDKDEHGNSLIGILILVLCVFLGLVLIGIGWAGATAVVAPAA